MPIYVAEIIAVVAAIALTVLSLIFITPKSKREKLNKYLQFVHDLFNFKFLLLEKVLKVLYIFATAFCIAFGFFGLFAGTRTMNWFGETHFESFALPALLILILGPIVVRIIFESTMMFIMLVKNTIEINKKLPDQNK